MGEEGTGQQSGWNGTNIWLHQHAAGLAGGQIGGQFHGIPISCKPSMLGCNLLLNACDVSHEP